MVREGRKRLPDAFPHHQVRLGIGRGRRQVHVIERAYADPCPADPQGIIDTWDKDLTPDASPDQIAEAAQVVLRVQTRREVARISVLVRDSI